VLFAPEDPPKFAGVVDPVAGSFIFERIIITFA
jgi:hypothetical protein